MSVSITADANYGKATFKEDNNGSTRLVVGTTLDPAHICLSALTGKHTNVD